MIKKENMSSYCDGNSILWFLILFLLLFLNQNLIKKSRKFETEADEVKVGIVKE